MLGSTLGPLVTGFLLLEWVDVDTAFRIVGLCSAALAVVCAIRAGASWPTRAVVPMVLGALGLLLSTAGSGFVASAGTVIDGGDLHGMRAPAMRHRIENRHGIVHTVRSEGRDDDIVYGGNAYDGRINIDLRNDTNGIARVAVLAAMQQHAGRVLVVGLSAGAWTRILQGFPGLERIDAVDINPAYIDLISRYPQVAPILRDPRIQLHVDDGRRWLKRSSGQRFDLIVMNNTLHGRSYSTNLLSIEFMRELRMHLVPGGLMAFNTTGSQDAALTAMQVFPHCYRHSAMVYCSERDFRPTPVIAESRLAALTLDGQPILTTSDFAQAEGAGRRLVAMATGVKPVHLMFDDVRHVARVITDANMLTEYRHGSRLEAPPIVWLLPSKEDTRIRD